MNQPRTTSAPETQDHIRALLEQREQLNGWLDRLRDVDDDTPARIAERVRADYLNRLEALTEELSGHAETLENQLAELREELEGAQTASADAADALAEARLRYRIGELDDESWEEHHPQLEQAAEKAADAAEEARERVSRLAELVGEITAAPAPAPDSLAAAADEPPSTQELGWLTEKTVLSEEPAADTDLAFLQSLEDQTIESPALLDADAVWAESREPETAAPAESEAPGDDMAFLEELDRAIAASLVSETPGEEPAEAADPGPEPVSCRECGAANDAQAWYCEICGSEL